MRHLNRRELANADRADLLVLLHELIVQLDNTPDTAAKQTVVPGSIFRQNRDILDAKIGKLRLITVFPDIQLDGQFINHRITAALAQNGEDLLRFVRTDKVIRQNLLDVADPLVDHIWIVRAAILPKQEFQNVNGYIRALFDRLGEVLADDFAVKTGAELAVECFAGAFFERVVLRNFVLLHLFKFIHRFSSSHLRIQNRNHPRKRCP